MGSWCEVQAAFFPPPSPSSSILFVEALHVEAHAVSVQDLAHEQRTLCRWKNSKELRENDPPALII